MPATLLLSGVLLALPAASGATAREAATARESAGTREAAGLPFIEDDYGRALAAAKSRHVPIFVEAWAPW